MFGGWLVLERPRQISMVWKVSGTSAAGGRSVKTQKASSLTARPAPSMARDALLHRPPAASHTIESSVCRFSYYRVACLPLLILSSRLLAASHIIESPVCRFSYYRVACLPLPMLSSRLSAADLFKKVKYRSAGWKEWEGRGQEADLPRPARACSKPSLSSRNWH